MKKYILLFLILCGVEMYIRAKVYGPLPFHIQIVYEFDANKAPNTDQFGACWTDPTEQNKTLYCTR